MIDEQQSIELISKRFPSFFSSETWKEHHDFWGNEEAGFGNTVNAFSDYCTQLFFKGKIDEIRPIFSFVEEMLKEGNDCVKNAFCTCFLENILNLIPSKILPMDFVLLLGPLSADYCRAWDSFTGIRTEGLHD